MITHPHATRCFLLAVGTVAALGLLLVAQPPLQPALSLVHGESAARTEGATHPETAESADGCIGNASGYACEPTFFIYGASKCATSWAAPNSSHQKIHAAISSAGIGIISRRSSLRLR